MKNRILAMGTMALIAVALVLTACSAPSPTAQASAAPDVTPSGTLALNPAASTSATASSSAEAMASASVTATTTSAHQTFTGYLIDQLCGVSGTDIQDGTDLTKHPEKHTLSCAMMPGCQASGYGIMMKQSDGTYKYFKFDAAGSAMALNNILNKTSKVDNFLVDVMGAMNGDTITVASITLK